MKKIIHGILAALFAISISLALVGCPDLFPLEDPDDVVVTDVAVTEVTLNQNSHTLIEGHTFTLTATVLPTDAKNKAVTWASNSDSVATVDDNGEVTAVAEGTATITVTTEDGGFTDTCTVTVIADDPDAILVTSVSFNKTGLSLEVGGKETLAATVLPADATNKTLNWASSNGGVATVNGVNGVGEVTAHGAGTATITATAVLGTTENIKATCTVTVIQPVTGVSLNKTALNLTTGATETLVATVAPATASNKNVTWSTSNSSVATVTNGVVTAVSVGSATITVTTVDGSKTATCTVTVTAPVVDPPPVDPPPPSGSDITAAELVAGMTIGWNLGNSLDATGGWNDKPNPTVDEMERGWGNPATTKVMIDTIKTAGFNTIRIPVSWTKASSGSPNYTIREDWMNRVKQVVDYAVANDMYIILNTHHDEEVFTFMNLNVEAGKAAFKKIWDQIAVAFRDYDEKLIFEGLNEPRTKESAAEWQGGTPEERNNLNAYYPIFVKAVRDSGGNNAKRILMINPYAASGTYDAMNALVLPTDTVQNKLIVSFHNYAPYDFAMNEELSLNTWSASNTNDTSPITGPIDNYYLKFVSKGIPVIIGEFGATNKNNISTRATWAEYYVKYAWSKGVKCVLWDNNVTTIGGESFGLLNRSNNTFYHNELLAGLMAGVGNPGDTPGGGDGTYAGVWYWFDFTDSDNGGTSSITLQELSDGVSVSGTVTTAYANGFAGWGASPDDATSDVLATATAISFKVTGDGKTYRIVLPTTDITEWNYYVTTFTTTAGVEETKTISISSFTQPSWGTQKPLDRTKIENVQWQTPEGMTGTFSLSVRDLKLVLP